MGTEIESKKLNFDSLKEFYPYYLGEHKNKLSRRLHFTGTLVLYPLFYLQLVLEYTAIYFWDQFWVMDLHG